MRLLPRNGVELAHHYCAFSPEDFVSFCPEFFDDSRVSEARVGVLRFDI